MWLLRPQIWMLDASRSREAFIALYYVLRVYEENMMTIDKDDPSQGVLKTTALVHVRSVQWQAAARAWPPVSVLCPGQAGISWDWFYPGSGWAAQPSQSVYTDLGSLGQRPEAVCSGAQSQKLLLRTQLCRWAETRARARTDWPCSASSSPASPVTPVTCPLRRPVTSGHVGPGQAPVTQTIVYKWQFDMNVG